jgi:hypothetical protein
MVLGGRPGNLCRTPLRGGIIKKTINSTGRPAMGMDRLDALEALAQAMHAAEVAGNLALKERLATVYYRVANTDWQAA